MPTLAKVHWAGGVLVAAVVLVTAVKFTAGHRPAPATSISDQPKPAPDRRYPAYVSQQPTILKAETSSGPGATVSPLAQPQATEATISVHDEEQGPSSPLSPGGYLPAPPLEETLHRR
jgi:hypothetical protein